jgi:5-formyltetrahydrofolate cyclo-ligase
VKKERRLYYRQVQNSFPLDKYREWNEKLAPNLKKVISRVPKGSLVAVYQARAKEASLHSLYSLPYKFCFPKVLSDDGQMEFRFVENAADEKEFSLGPYGILEPKAKHPVVEKSEMRAAFVPLLSFDLDGRRLGQGKGFYDRFLHDFPGLKVGVGFEWQLAPDPLPVDAHDKLMNLVVTECEIREFEI